jgi:hypothetical protein
MPDTIDRDILFFRIDTGFDMAGKPKTFDPAPVFEHINKLAWKGDNANNRYSDKDKDGKIMGCWIYDTKVPSKIILGNIRRTDFPLLEIQGERSPLELPEQAGLVEQTHMVFLGNDIVGCDVNFYGPRVSRLSFYLSEKAVGIAPEVLRFNPILRRDIFQQLKKIKYLKSLDIKVRPSYEDTIANIDQNLSAALKTALEAGGNVDIDVELILQASRTSVGWLPEHWLENIKALFSKKPITPYDLEKLTIRGYNEDKKRDDTINLLSDKLIVKRSILRLDYKSRALNSKAAFDAIIDAYEEIKDELLVAPSAII